MYQTSPFRASAGRHYFLRKWFMPRRHRNFGRFSDAGDVRDPQIAPGLRGWGGMSCDLGDSFPFLAPAVDRTAVGLIAPFGFSMTLFDIPP
jgi:hypothetical protein